ncbi:hypothetical protein [Pseudomonas alloputida]|uniref:hypothetical protein n=1 Tax=Pseudomonas TaxID=286 RepID=UPI003EE84967
MSDEQYIRIFVDKLEKLPLPPEAQEALDHQMQPDASASYQLEIMEVTPSLERVVVALDGQGELALPQTFCIPIDGDRLKIGNQYRATVMYKINQRDNQGGRMIWTNLFTLENSALVTLAGRAGHGPCMGRTSACFSW